MVPRFFQLDNGDWVDPAYVISARLREKRADSKTGEIATTLFIDLRDARFFTVDFQSREEAVKCRDTLALAVKGEL